jgi:hypothetical protein
MNNANRAKAKVASKCSEKDGVGKDTNYGDKPHVALTSFQGIVDKSEPMPLAYSSTLPGKLYDLLANSETNGPHRQLSTTWTSLQDSQSFYVRIDCIARVSTSLQQRAGTSFATFLTSTPIGYSWFQKSNFAAYQRQLYNYGFRRIACEFFSLMAPTQCSCHQRAHVELRPRLLCNRQAKHTITRSSCVANPMW